MGDISVIVEGIHSEENAESYRSTVHGAGRIMSRTQAAGKMNYKLRTRMGGEISEEQMHAAIRAYGVELRVQARTKARLCIKAAGCSECS